MKEWCCEYGGARQFMQEVVGPGLKNEFPAGMVVKGGWGDPSGMRGADADSTLSAFWVLNEEFKLGIEPIRTNEFVPRRDAVIEWLRRGVGDEPALVIDPGCVMLRRGFNGGYHFRSVPVAGEERYKEKPEKNEYSHVHDALQSLCLGIKDVSGEWTVVGRRGVYKHPDAMAEWEAAVAG